MKSLVALAALCGSLAIPALTQAAPAGAGAGVDPVKLQLARELVEAQGGRDRVERQMTAMMATINAAVFANLPPEDKEAAQRRQATIQAPVISLIPTILDISTRNYAEAFTEQELRDDLAFMRSPSGQAIAEKSPAILQKSMAETFPIIMARMPKLMAKAVDDLCAEKHCTPDQRQQMMAAVTKAFPGSSRPPSCGLGRSGLP